MNLPFLVIASLGLWLTCQVREDPAVQPLRGFQGEWALVATANEKRPDRGDDCIRMRIQGNQVTMKFASRVTNQGTVEVGRLMGTNTLDMKLVNGRTVQGIYDLRDAMLLICLDEASNGRPGTLTPKGTQWTETWKRVTP